MDVISETYTDYYTRLLSDVHDLDDHQAHGFLAIVAEHAHPLRLDFAGWRMLAARGYSRADVRKAIDRLLDDGVIDIYHDVHGVLTVALGGATS